MPQICSWKDNKTRQNNASKITIIGVCSSKKKRKLRVISEINFTGSNSLCKMLFMYNQTFHQTFHISNRKYVPYMECLKIQKDSDH